LLKTNRYFAEGMRIANALPIPLSQQSLKIKTYESILKFIHKQGHLPISKPPSIEELDTIKSQINPQQNIALKIQEHIAMYADEYELARRLDDILFQREIKKIMEEIAINIEYLCVTIDNAPDNSSYALILA